MIGRPQSFLPVFKALLHLFHPLSVQLLILSAYTRILSAYNNSEISESLRKSEKIQAKFSGVQGYLDFLRAEDVQRSGVNDSSQTSLNGLKETPPPSSCSQQKRVKEKF